MMTMAMDNSNRYGAINFENISYPGAPQFNHPWPPSTSSSSASHGVYASTQHNMNHNIPLDVKPLPQHRRLSGNLPLGPYGHVSVSSASSGSPLDAYTSQPPLTSSQDILNNSRSVSTAFDSSYATSHSPATANQQSFSPNSAPYESMGYAPAPVRSTYAIQPHESSRRLSPPSVNATSDDASAKAPRSYRLFPPIDVQDSNHSNENRGYMETMDPNHRMIPMAQSTSPRNFYAPPRIRGSGDSYGFQGSATHSNASSLSSPGGYQPYFASAVGSHVGEYVSHGMPGNSSDIDSVASRTLPRPSNLLSTGVPPAPQSMMGQFSSKVSSSTQKKHKCKVCDKRFTRPSSLQTHMYSHTGEKPFSCNVEGCGRQFSVVSNLRRHRKVHKGEARSEAGSEEHQPEE